MSLSSRSILFCGVLAAATSTSWVGLADAATTSSTGTGGSSGSGTAGTGGSGGTTGGDTGGSGSSSGGLCGEECVPPPGESVQISAPADGATVSSPVSVTVHSTYKCSSADCGMFEDPPMSVSIIVDANDTIACDVGECVREIDLAPGEHTIQALAQYSFSNVIATINITVEGAPSTTTGGDDTAGLPMSTTSGGSSSGSTTGEEKSDDSGGCGCRSTAPVSPAGWGALLLVVGAFVRRRR